MTQSAQAPEPEPGDAAAAPQPASLSLCEPPPPGRADARVEGQSRAYEAALMRARAGIIRILAASDVELRSRAFLLGCIELVGLCYQDWPGLAPFSGYMNPVDCGMLQIPTEFADYLALVGAARPASAIEVGVHHGSASYLAAAYFYRLNKQHVYTAVDIKDELADFDYYKNILPIVKAAPATSGHFAGQQFDLAFIDGDHSYDGSRLDWLNVGRYASVAAFHDIKGAEYDHLNGGIRRTWTELKLEYRASRTILEVSHHPDWMGIGVVFNRPPPGATYN